jgi:CRISPR-associated protein Cmr3
MIGRQWCEERKRTIRVSEVDEPIAAKLVAACVPKPIPVVGWTERLHLLKDEIERGHWQEGGNAHGPRPTHLAVPAGAVYYFETESSDDAEKLAAALNWHGSEKKPVRIKNRRSTLMGEKGFGLGVCGAWNFYEGEAGK